MLLVSREVRTGESRLDRRRVPKRGDNSRGQKVARAETQTVSPEPHANPRTSTNISCLEYGSCAFAFDVTRQRTWEMASSWTGTLESPCKHVPSPLCGNGHGTAFVLRQEVTQTQEMTHPSIFGIGVREAAGRVLPQLIGHSYVIA